MEIGSTTIYTYITLYLRKNFTLSPDWWRLWLWTQVNLDYTDVRIYADCRSKFNGRHHFSFANWFFAFEFELWTQRWPMDGCCGICYLIILPLSIRKSCLLLNNFLFTDWFGEEKQCHSVWYICLSKRPIYWHRWTLDTTIWPLHVTTIIEPHAILITDHEIHYPLCAMIMNHESWQRKLKSPVTMTIESNFIFFNLLNID